MSRPLRNNYPGGIYHITSRGNERKPIYRKSSDRNAFLNYVSQTISRYQWICHSYCLMDNHYHLLIETPHPNLSLGMRHLNGVYTQFFNRAYKRVGHLFQGRFKCIIVERGRHLMELCRYIVLNPVRANICNKPEAYNWSSYCDMLRTKKRMKWLHTTWILNQFGETRAKAVKAFKQYVEEGMDDKPWERIRGQIYYGSEEFIAQMSTEEAKMDEIPRVQQQPFQKTLEELIGETRNVQAAYQAGYRLKEIARYLKVHYATVSRWLKEAEGKIS